MLPRPLVPPSLVPFLDPGPWLAGFLVLGAAALALRALLPERARPAWGAGGGALASLGLGTVLLLQKKALVAPVILSWPGFLLWAGLAAALATGLVRLAGAARRRRPSAGGARGAGAADGD